MAELTYAQVSQLLKYDPETGKLFWLPRPAEMFATGHQNSAASAARWNGRYAGKEAFTAKLVGGYSIGRMFDRPFSAHRVCWMLTHREWPKGQIDHINGVRDDNRLLNLRIVTHSGNARNQKRRSDNTSGVTGVSRYPNDEWQAVIKHNGKIVWLGHFPNFNDAVAARKVAEKKYGYHENHGRNAKAYPQ